MERFEVTVEPGGVITLPPEVLEATGISDGDSVIWFWEGRSVLMRLATPEEIEMYPLSGNDPVEPA